jgi:hypothetical protein
VGLPERDVPVGVEEARHAIESILDS